MKQSSPMQRWLRRLGSPIVSIVLLVALAYLLLATAPRLGAVHLPGNQQGYEPAQPIAFSHRLHAGELEVSCLYCHSAAEQSRHAAIPAASTCMNCHQFVTAPWGVLRQEYDQAQKENRPPQRVISPEIQKIYDALALNEKGEPDPGKQPHPIAWNKVHNLPDFVYFNHSAHVNAGVGCQQCHGPVETMERVRQVSDLSMGWCVNCHREVNAQGVEAVQKRAGLATITARPVPPSHKPYASIDCSTCHY